jgi:N-methylhydantoinase A
VIFPPQASVLSAVGTLVTPVRLDLVRSALGRLDALDRQEVDRLLDEMTAEGLASLAEAGCAAETVRLSVGADLRYHGQQNEVTVTFDHDPRQRRDPEAIRSAFEAAYVALYGVTPSHVPIEVVSWRLTVQGPEIPFAPAPNLNWEPGRPKGERAVALWAAAGPARVYDRSALGTGQCIAGPAIIEERETTLVIPPGWSAVVDELGCVVARQEA